VTDNPYRAPQTDSPVGDRFGFARVAVAVLIAAFGVLPAIAAVRHFLALFSGPGPGRDIAAFGFPAFAAVAVGCFTGALGIARGGWKLLATGTVLFVLGFGGWNLFLYAVMAGWFQ
jgi:hypothetical protein